MSHYKTSISPISEVIATNGSMPVRVLCDDFEFYIGKYVEGIPPSKLFNEYVCACFAESWNLRIPFFTFIHISTIHIPNEILTNRIQRRYFDTTCFGSRVLPNAQEVTPLTTFNEKETLKANKKDLLKIALFDIWLCNEDRNHNNYNLLYKLEQEQLNWYVIDHVNCFNTGNYYRDLVEITQEDSLISSDVCIRLLKGNKKLKETVEEIRKEFYLCVKKCAANLPLILENLPEDWQIPKQQKESLNRLFSDRWIEKSVRTFEQYIQLYLYQ